MRDCANCFHRKPVLKEDGTWTAECEKWDCEFQSRENMVEKTEPKQGDLISREALKKTFENACIYGLPMNELYGAILKIIDNAPTVEAEKTKESEIIKAYTKGFDTGVETVKNARPQGEYVDISKLRLMTVEECAGHTIDYALGWKACIEWIKKGGAE